MKRLLIILLCLFPTWLWAAAGKLDSFEGDVKVIAKGNSKNAVSGLEINEGDQVRTGANSWALFEMNDGATITVRPSTEIRIGRYRYAEDGRAAQNSSVIELTKGALRMITGLIGQSNRSGYAINTPTAKPSASRRNKVFESEQSPHQNPSRCIRTSKSADYGSR